MNRNQAARARGIAYRALAYRAWYIDPIEGVIPSIGVLSDRLLHRREQDRQLRRAQFGMFDTVAPVASPRIASAL